MTEAEKLLWSKIRRKQVNDYQFYRQKILGSYIVDFYCPKTKLIIELDGSQHYNSEGISKDKTRDTYMKRLGLNVLRISDNEIFNNINGVIEKIAGYL
jgi:very-short-patch-repair endonuclease